MERSWDRLIEKSLRHQYQPCLSFGVQLLATPELILQLGDRLTVVGEKAAILNVEKVLGNAIKSLKEPNLVVIFIGIVLGLALGAIPFSIPGVSTPRETGTG